MKLKLNEISKSFGPVKANSNINLTIGFYAYNLINKWPKWEKNIVNINGEKFSGKTHLTNIFLKKFKGKKIDSHEFNDESLKSFKIFENLVLDNFDENVNERLMYSLFNVVDQDNKFVIINSLVPINKINFKLDDLNSRVKNCLFAKIEKESFKS